MKEHKDDILNSIERLAVVAQHDTAPMTNVSASVMRRIRREQTVISEKPLVVLAMGSLAVAIAVLIVSIPTIAALTDPLNDLFQSTPLAMM